MTVYDIIKELCITKGWSPVYGECTVEPGKNPNKIVIGNGCDYIILFETGKFTDGGEIIIFPSKDDRDWDKFYYQKKKQLLPFNTPVMVPEEGDYWELRFYKIARQCSISKLSKDGTVYLDFEGNEGDVWEVNIKDLKLVEKRNEKSVQDRNKG